MAGQGILPQGRCMCQRLAKVRGVKRAPTNQTLCTWTKANTSNWQGDRCEGWAVSVVTDAGGLAATGCNIDMSFALEVTTMRQGITEGQVSLGIRPHSPSPLAMSGRMVSLSIHNSVLS